MRMPSRTIAAITALGLLLRLATLRAQGSAWMDELFSLHFASLPFFKGLSYLMFDVHPPLYGALLSLWGDVFGTGVLQGRLLSVLIGTATVPAVAWLAKEAGLGVRGRRIAALCTAVSPVLLFHSAEARMYPLLVLLVIVCTAAFFRMLRVGTERSVRAWAIAAGAMLLVHVTAAVPFAVMAAWGIMRTRRARRRRFIVTALLAAAPFTVWLFFSASAHAGSLGAEWQFSQPSAPSPGAVLAAFFAYGSPAWITPLLALAVAGLVLRALGELRKEGHGLVFLPEVDETSFVLALCAVAPFILALPFGTATVKYHFVALPAVVVLASSGTEKLFARASARTRRAALVVFLLLLLVPIASLSTGRRIRWDDAFAFVERNERPGDLLYLEWFASELPARAYYDGDLRPVSGYPYDPALSFEDRLVRHAGQIRTTPEMLRTLAKNAEYASRVFVVGGAGSVASDPVQRWFAEQGWRLEDAYEGDEWSPTVSLYARTSY